MSDLELFCINKAINSNKIPKKIKIVFNNGQKINFSISKPMILELFGYNRNNSDDKNIKIFYNNSNQFKRNLMYKTSEIINSIFSEENMILENILMLTYYEPEECLELIVKQDDEFVGIEFDRFNNKMSRFNIIDDVSSYISEKKFVIPVSFTYSTKNGFVNHNEFDKEQVLKIKEASSIIAKNFNAIFIDDQILYSNKKENNYGKN